MSLEEIASELHLQPSALQRRWRKLQRKHGFPRPLPGVISKTGQPVWSKLLVVAWLRGAAQATDRPANDDRIGVDTAALIEAQRAALRRAIEQQERAS